MKLHITGTLDTDIQVITARKSTGGAWSRRLDWAGENQINWKWTKKTEARLACLRFGLWYGKMRITRVVRRAHTNRVCRLLWTLGTRWRHKFKTALGARLTPLRTQTLDFCCGHTLFLLCKFYLNNILKMAFFPLQIWF